VLGHQFGQHLVLSLNLFFQELDSLLFGLVVRPALALKDSSTVLEKFFLPTLEHRWLQPVFLAQIGNRQKTLGLFTVPTGPTTRIYL
jgi:hypothetical protein